MARRIDKNKAIKMRESGMSYSQIKSELGVSKSTLSLWLRDLPLSDARLRELRDFNQVRIEKTRLKKQQKQSMRLDSVANKASVDIGTISNRELLIAGFFLYWAEGSKSMNASIALTNTNPQMILFFIEWMRIMGVSKGLLRVSLQLYSDMDPEKQLSYWSKKLRIDRSQFYNPRIKKSAHASITYTNGFGQGTCTVTFGSKKMKDLVMMGIKRLEDMMFENEFQLVFPKMCAY